MPEPIVEVAIKPSADKLRLEWGMTVQAGKWVFPHPTLEVHLYCRPFSDLGKPDLLNMDLDESQTTHTGGGTFKIPFLDLTVGKEKTHSAFRRGMVTADPTGKYYPLYFDLEDADIPAGGVMCYPAVEWPVSNNWMERAFDCWVVFGHTERGTFIPVHEEPPYEHRPNDKKVGDRLPDDIPAVAETERVRRRGATKHLFISYSHADIFAVNQIVKRLNDELYYDVWIDYDNISGGSLWREEIARGIQGSDRVLFMLSPSSANSRWCQEEIRYAVERGVRVIPVRIHGGCGDTELAKVGLNGTQYRDFAKDPPDWERLLRDDLPEVMPRNRRWRDEAFRNRHTDYLRSLFHRYSRVNLTYLLDAMPKEEVSLLDVYVPLFMGINIWGKVKNGELDDWWIWPTDQEGRRRPVLGDSPENQPRPKQFPGMHVEETILNLIIDRVHASAMRWSDGEHSLWRFESEEVPALQPHLVITGDPGSGKSTLVKHLALCMAGDQLLEAANEVERRADLDLLGFWPHPAFTPVVIELRDLVQKVFLGVHDRVTLEKLYTYLRDEQLTPAGCTDYLNDLRNQMRDGDVMFFLDGLDEVPDAETGARRQQIKSLANLLRDNFPLCRIVITARPYAYAGDWQIDGFGQVSLAPLDTDRLEQLAIKLFQQVLGVEGAEEQAPQFKEQMEKLPDELRRSPLFFTLLAAIWLNDQTAPPDQRLPLSPGAIYRACVEMLLRRWTRKDLQTSQSVADVIGLDETQIREMLERLAYRVHRQHIGDADSGFECGLIMTVIRTEMKIKGVDYDMLLDTLAQRAGVIYERAPDEFAFAHRSFQEHLAACYWAKPDLYPEVMTADIVQSPGLWRNVFELFPDEARRNKLDLWAVVERCLPEGETTWPVEPDDLAWWRVFFAARLMREHIPAGDRQQRLFRPFLRDALIKLVSIGALPPGERAEMGRLLAALGDPRSGVLAPNNVPDFVWCEVPAGRFKMGGDPAAAHNNRDGAEFDLPYTFWIAKYPVTVAQYAEFVEAGGYQKQRYWTDAGWAWKKKQDQPRYWNDPQWRIANHPVVGVSWYEAHAYTGWLNEQQVVKPTGAPENYVIRLARECEWEKAARYPDGRFFPWGNEWDAAKLNSSEGGLQRTSAVGIFPDGANPAHGACDLSGNVWEWCLTTWEADYDLPETEDNRSTGDAVRCLRGGSWDDRVDYCRSAARFGGDPGYWYFSWGFRVVVSVPIEL